MNTKYPRVETRKLTELSKSVETASTATPEDLFHLKKQVQKFGLLKLPTLNVQTGRLLDMTDVVVALRELGHEEVQVLCVDVDEKHERAAHYALNNRAGDWVWKTVSGDLVAMRDAGVALELTGFKPFDWQPLMAADWSAKALDPALMEQQERSLF